LFTSIAGPIAIVAILAAGILAYGIKQYSEIKRLREENKKAEEIVISRQQALEARQRAGIYSAARYGTSEEVAKIYTALARDAALQFATQGRADYIADPKARSSAQKAWLENQFKSVQEDVLKARVTAGMFTTLTERTVEQKQYEDDMKSVNLKLLKVNEEQKGLLDIRQKQEHGRIQEEAIERAKIRAWRNPWATAQDVWTDIFFGK
jgi:hypothetical protein